MPQNKVSQPKREVKMPHKKPLKNSYIYIYIYIYIYMCIHISYIYIFYMCK